MSEAELETELEAISSDIEDEAQAGKMMSQMKKEMSVSREVFSGSATSFHLSKTRRISQNAQFNNFTTSPVLMSFSDRTSSFTALIERTSQLGLNLILIAMMIQAVRYGLLSRSSIFTPNLGF